MTRRRDAGCGARSSRSCRRRRCSTRSAGGRPVRSRSPTCVGRSRGQWHVTLQFLGRVDDVDALVDALRAVTAAAAPFEVELEGAGAYPSAARKILWIGVGAGASELTELAANVASVSEGLGDAVEHRRTRPT